MLASIESASTQTLLATEPIALYSRSLNLIDYTIYWSDIIRFAVDRRSGGRGERGKLAGLFTRRPVPPEIKGLRRVEHGE